MTTRTTVHVSYSHNESHSDEGWLKFELDFRVRVRVGMTRSQTE